YKKKLSSYRGMKLKYIPTIKSKNFEMICYAFFSAISTVFKNYDINHFHAIGPSTLSFIPKFFGKKLVVTVHGLDWQREKWNYIAKSYLKFGEWTSIRIPHQTIVVSKTLKQYYEDKYSKKVKYIPNGINNTKYTPLTEAGKKFSLKKNRYLLFVGRLTKEKNVHILIQAFKSLNTDMKLVIVGGSSHTDDYIIGLKKLADSDNRIILTGPIYDQLLPQIYSNAFLFILPSALEGLPVVLLEALSYGNGVLVSDIPENVEVIQDDVKLKGFTFKSGKVDSLRSILNDLVNTPKKVEDMKNMGRKFVLEKYSWDEVTEKTVELYKNLITNRV
ncbi:glycosyltransferase family 4 protein, partial [Acidobacteriota bacterium]